MKTETGNILSLNFNTNAISTKINQFKAKMLQFSARIWSMHLKSIQFWITRHSHWLSTLTIQIVGKHDIVIIIPVGLLSNCDYQVTASLLLFLDNWIANVNMNISSDNRVENLNSVRNSMRMPLKMTRLQKMSNLLNTIHTNGRSIWESSWPDVFE